MGIKICNKKCASVWKKCTMHKKGARMCKKILCEKNAEKGGNGGGKVEKCSFASKLNDWQNSECLARRPKRVTRKKGAQ